MDGRHAEVGELLADSLVCPLSFVMDRVICFLAVTSAHLDGRHAEVGGQMISMYVMDYGMFLPQGRGTPGWTLEGAARLGKGGAASLFAAVTCRVWRVKTPCITNCRRELTDLVKEVQPVFLPTAFLPAKVGQAAHNPNCCRELTDLVKEVQPAARRPSARLSFAFIYPDRRGRNVMRNVSHASSPSLLQLLLSFSACVSAPHCSMLG